MTTPTQDEIEALVDGWDDLKDNLPSTGHDAAERLYDYGDKMADAITTLQARVAELEGALRKAKSVSTAAEGYNSAPLVRLAQRITAVVDAALPAADKGE